MEQHTSGDPVTRRSARTLDDVAALSGASRATVSRVINGKPVSEAMQRRVRAALEGTDYRPNAAARTLVTGHSGVVGVVIHLDPHLLFGDPYFSQLLQGITDHLAEQGAGMMLWLGNRTKQETLDHVLWMGLLDGVIVTANTREDPLVDGLLASPLPTVLIGHRSADRSASYVDVDHVAAADMVTSHLVSIGRRRIGHITGRRGTVAGEDRIEGYRRAMGRAGLAADGLIVEGDFNKPSGTAGAFRLLDCGIDALFCGNDAMASGALEAIRERGLRVPDDVALAGFDDLEFASHLDPPLTTVRQGVREQGSEAAAALFDLMGDPGAAPRRVILPTELVIRQSTVGTAQRS
ncbi:MAG: LacI family DNA-binding transcriptional regulator [Candidatus Limnocylindrales bacterium]